MKCHFTLFNTCVSSSQDGDPDSGQNLYNPVPWENTITKHNFNRIIFPNSKVNFCLEKHPLVSHVKPFGLLHACWHSVIIPVAKSIRNCSWNIINKLSSDPLTVGYSYWNSSYHNSTKIGVSIVIGSPAPWCCLCRNRGE